VLYYNRIGQNSTYVNNKKVFEEAEKYESVSA